MNQLRNNRKALIAAAIIIAFVAVVVPTCRMVGCEMLMGGYMPFMHTGDAFGVFSDCGGAWSVTDAPVGVVPVGLETLVLALLAAFVAGLVLFQPQLVARPVRIVDAAPPPPPEDPLGVRFRV